MKKILYILLFVPLIGFGQEQDACYSINEVFSQMDVENPSITKNFVAGWNMFGYPCSQPIDLAEAFSSIVDKIVIVKDNSGAVYMPEWEFNGIGFLEAAEGYQIKMSNTENDFSFCETINWPNLEGCTDCIAFNFNSLATSNNGSCEYQGCMDLTADNYNPNAVISDYCQYLGCMDAMAGNYLPQANEDDGSCVVAEACPYDIYVEYSADAQSYNANLCQTLIVFGCTDYIAVNYDNQANTDDYSCEYILGCMDASADNYNTYATQEDNSCIYYGCMDEQADNYNQQANQEDNSCIYYGCMNPTADNYDSQANQDDGNCVIYGCILDVFPNYNSEATIDDFSCDMSSADVFGCTDPSYLEYTPSVNHDNGTCSVEVVYGCTGADHCNYNPEANTDDGSCIYPEQFYDCDGNSLQVLEIGALMNGGIVFYIDETGQHGLVAATEDLTEGSNMGPWGTPEGFEWGCYGSTVSGADGQSIGTGYQNTLDIVAQNCQTENGGITAAQATLNYESEGYSDWYLPSKDELVEMHNTIGNGGPEGNIGGFEMSDYPYYWSSSENINNYAWYVYFSNGLTSNYYKNYSLRVRAVRAF